MSTWTSDADAKIVPMKPPLYVYISGPYSLGGQGDNVRRAIVVADAIRDAGHYVFVPHLFHFWDMVAPRSYDDWLRLDIAWLRKCDAFVRLPGESAGADAEERIAEEMHIPIYHDWRQFLIDHG